MYQLGVSAEEPGIAAALIRRSTAPVVMSHWEAQAAILKSFAALRPSCNEWLAMPAYYVPAARHQTQHILGNTLAIPALNQHGA